MTTVQIGWE